MNPINIKRVIKFGILNFWRNNWLSFAASLVLALTLITITLSVIQNIDIQRAITSIKDRLDMTVYFDDSVSEANIQDIRVKLSLRSDVNSVKYISKDDALKVWQQRPATQSVKDLVTPDSNPLPRSLSIKSNDPSSLDNIAKFLQSPEFKGEIRRISYEDNKKIIQDLIASNDHAKRVGLISSITFVIISLIVLINTIRTILLSRREEIEIMRLVGASNLFIKGPFYVESLLTALLASILSMAFLVLGVVYNLPIIPSFVSNYFGGLGTGLNTLLANNFATIFLGQFIIAFILIVVTTLISMRRYLRG
jgi:cell division transport system permease protein